MKTIILLLAGAVMTSFTGRPAEDIDGVWMGYYRSELSKEKVILKLNNEDRMEFYTGGVDDQKKIEGTYRMNGDSISFYYKTTDGESILMQGHLNRRKNFVDGICRTNEKPTGSFYLEKQEVEERFVEP
jgi:hypothetical protein